MKRLDSTGNLRRAMTALSLPAPQALECDAPTLATRSGALLHRVRDAAAAIWRLAPGRYLAIPDGDDVVVLPLGRLTRIGRRVTSDIVLDDSTVSRRHALVLDRGGGAVIADDRSLNGVFVNGERVDLRALDDGDELTIGRFHLHFMSLTGESALGQLQAPGAFA